MKTDKHWKRIGLFPHHGICLPLSALRTKKSCGIGEFLDLIPLIDWCSSLKMDCLQLLPLNDSGNDPSPYNALTSCALDPVYLSLASLPDAGSKSLPNLNSFSPFSQTQRVSIIEVKQRKIDWLRGYFSLVFPSVSKTASYQNFVKSHPWVETYALFKSLKNQFQDQYWKDWPLEYQSPKPEHFVEQKKEIDFYCFLQFLWKQSGRTPPAAAFLSKEMSLFS